MGYVNNKVKRIMVIGAGPLQLPAIKKIKELGFKAVSVDANPNAIGFNYSDDYKQIDIVDKDACLQYAVEMNIDGVLTVATDFGVLTTSYIAEQLKLPGLNMSIAKIVKDKYKVRDILNKKGLESIPQFFEVKNPVGIDKIKDIIIYPIIVKPADGSGSTAVAKVNSYEELLKASQEAINTSLIKKAIIESFIDGQEYGVESFVYNGEVNVLGILKKIMTPEPYFAELGHICPSGLSECTLINIEETVKNVIKNLDINYGSVNMDLIINKEGKVTVVDIGARMGGNLIGSHIIPLSTGIDLLSNIVKASIGEIPDFQRKFNNTIATRLLDFKPGIVKSIGDVKSLIDDNEVMDIIINVGEGEIVRQYRNNRDSCGYVVVKGDNVIKATEKAKLVRDKVEKLFLIEG